MRVGKRWALAALLVVALVGTACSGGGGGGGGDDDPTEGVLPTGERLVSFNGAGGLKLSGTLALPQNTSGGAAAVLIVPAIGPTIDREGIQNPTQGDLLYKDLSGAFTAAGLVTLRYDRRGIGASKLDSGAKPTYDDMIEDARGALKFLGQRREVGSSPIAVVGHDAGGWMAMKLASSESRVKGAALISTPGRPLVDVMADGFKASHGQASADKFRSAVSTLLSTGKLPGPEGIAPEHQTVLGQGQDDLLKGLYSVNPLADAGGVKVPTMVVAGGKSTLVGPADADLVSKAIGPAGQALVTESGDTLREVKPDTGPIPFNPNDESTHLFGARPVQSIPRDAAALEKITTFLTTTLRAGKT